MDIFLCSFFVPCSFDGKELQPASYVGRAGQRDIFLCCKREPKKNNQLFHAIKSEKELLFNGGFLSHDTERHQSETANVPERPLTLISVKTRIAVCQQ